MRRRARQFASERLRLIVTDECMASFQILLASLSYGMQKRDGYSRRLESVVDMAKHCGFPIAFASSGELEWHSRWVSVECC